jgi:SAM-dependent methyltransferase
MQKHWDEWPKWDTEHSFRTPRFQFVCSVSEFPGKTNSDKIAMLKDRHLLEIYRDLMVVERIGAIFEIGFFQGGMPLFLADMAAPNKIVAVDRYPPSDELTTLIARNNLSSSIELIGGVEQADVAKMRSILDAQFGSEPLDLIIDDCSHYYYETKACFEAFFGYLRPGGKYIIEDWAWTHWPGAQWQTSESHFHGMESMTNLIFELVMALGGNNGMISNVNILSCSCIIVTRGKNLPYKGSIDLRAMTNIAGGRQAELIVAAANAPIHKPPVAFSENWWSRIWQKTGLTKSR